MNARQETATPRILTAASTLLGVRYPIVQGGLARIARAELAAAVSEAGGLGQIAIAGLAAPELIRAEIRKARKMTSRPIGVNFPVGRMKIDHLIDEAVQEGVEVVSFTGGNPKPYIDRLQGTAVKVLVLVSGPEQARKAEQAGAHVLATVGYEGGGHIGRSDLTTLIAIPLVTKAVRIPVLAGGGIADGFGLAAALALGADGVEMGTRFIAAKEAYAHANYKDAVVRAGVDDTVVIKRSIGTPGRALANEWTARILNAERAGGPKEAIIGMATAEVNARAVEQGDMEQSVAWLGQAAALIDGISSAADIMSTMVNEAAEAAGRLHRLMSSAQAE